MSKLKSDIIIDYKVDSEFLKINSNSIKKLLFTSNLTEDDIKNCNSLEELNLYNSGIKNIPNSVKILHVNDKSEIYDISNSNVEELYLDNNKSLLKCNSSIKVINITGKCSLSLNNCNMLISLKLMDSNIISCEPFVKTLKYLKTNILNLNDIKCIENLKELHVYDNINKLDTFATSLEVLHINTLNNLNYLRNVKELYIYQNLKTGDINKFAKTLTKLKIYTLTNDMIKDCNKLIYLDTYSNNIDYSNFPNLRIVKNCNIDDISNTNILEVYSNCQLKKFNSVLKVYKGFVDYDDIKICNNLEELYLYDSNISNFDFCKNSLKILELNNCIIDSNALDNCTNISKLVLRNVNNIINCKSFANTLIYLETDSGIDNNSIKYCHNIKHLNANWNTTLTSCKPFAKKLEVLYAESKCAISDDSICKCINLKELYISSNMRIKSCEPFKDSIITLCVQNNCGINDIEIKKCKKLTYLNSTGNYNITIKI